MTPSPRRLLIRTLLVAQLTALALAALAIDGPSAESIDPNAAATSPIQHVVIVLKENRSFDEYFGQFPNLTYSGTNYGATTAKTPKGTVTLAQTPDPMPNDIDHSWYAWHIAYDNGAMDGFNKEKNAVSSTGQLLALSQMSQSQIPNYWAYADKYALAAKFFASWKGASFGNNLFEVAGQAGQYDKSWSGNRCVDNPATSGTQACHTNGRSVFALPYSQSGAKINWWGCDDPSDTVVTMFKIVNKKQVKTNMYPCYRFQSLPDQLAANGLSWGFYADSGGRVQRHDALDAIDSIRNNPTQWANVQSTSKFLTDAANGTLPNVSWVLGSQTEHAPLTACAGENQTVQFINAIMNGSDWGSTAIFVVWDEWGGFYDHIPPPVSDFVQYGFRVPFLAISPYTKAGPSSDGGSISFTQYSDASLLKFVEDNWSLPSLTPAVNNAIDLKDMFDYQRTPNGPLPLTARTCTALTPAEKRLYHRNPWD